MPSPLLAHQAPVLWLKLWRPRWFDTTALVIGSVAPDLEYLSNATVDGPGFGHTLAAQLYFCLPITLGAVFALGNLHLAETVAGRAPRVAGALGGSCAPLSVGELPRVALSALLGSGSHLVLDALTHDWLPRLFPRGTARVFGLTISSVGALQLGGSAVGGVITLLIVRALLAKTPPSSGPRRPGGLALAASAAIGVAFAFAWELPVLRDPESYFQAAPIYLVGHLAFVSTVFVFVFVGLAASILRLADVRADRAAKKASPAAPEG